MTDEVSKRLRALMQNDGKKSETMRLREVFEDLEAALKAGISQADVLAELHQLGFTMTKASFKSAVQRYGFGFFRLPPLFPHTLHGDTIPIGQTA